MLRIFFLDKGNDIKHIKLFAQRYLRNPIHYSVSRKRVTIHSPNTEFLSQTSEISVVHRLFYSGFVAISRFEIIWFSGPQIGGRIFRKWPKNGVFDFLFFYSYFLVDTNAKNIHNYIFLRRNSIRNRFLKSLMENFPFLTRLHGRS